MIEQSSFVYLNTFTHLSVLQLCKQSVPAISATFKHDIGLVNLSTRCKYTLSSIIMCIFNWNKAYDNDISFLVTFRKINIVVGMSSVLKVIVKIDRNQSFFLKNYLNKSNIFSQNLGIPKRVLLNLGLI